jgi:tRNA(Ile)-lysidine synthase
VTLAGRFGKALEALLPAPDLPRLGLAVSGGGDSMALMHLAARWARARRRPNLFVVTVDHGLRPESAAEAAQVARAAAALGLSHDTLRWEGWEGRGNLQDAARRARRRLIREWAEARGIEAVATGHTLDDQAETVLLRLARGSGVDGLAAMAPVRREARLSWLRPLLDLRREELRDWLRARNLGWIEDPSNEDMRFDRVRARRMLSPLAELGLTPERLAATARHMQAAREVLQQAAAALAQEAVREAAGALFLDIARFRAAPEETRHRLLAAALGWVSGAEYRPRHEPLARLAESLEGTLHGARVVRRRGEAIVLREAAAVASCRIPPPGPWDGRWWLEGPAEEGLVIAALGERGLAAVEDWRATGLPREVLEVTPAVWRNGTLVAAPLAGLSAGWRASLIDGRDSFVSDAFSR